LTHLTIENANFTAKIDPVGAQLVSLKRNTTDEEFIWQRDPQHWAESAPVCFPIVGNLRDGGYTHEGKAYSIAKHGCVRHQEFFKARHTGNSVALSFCANAKTKKSYPFNFKLTITFKVLDDGLRVEYSIENLDDAPMPMSLGYHPAIALADGASFSDFDIQFEEPEHADLYGVAPDGFGKREAGYLKNQNQLTLQQDIFDQDALVFKDVKSRKVTLVRRGTDWQLQMSTYGFAGGAPHLALWSKPGAPFICIEPWYICPDEADTTSELAEKPGMTILASSGSFRAGYEISI
jgi:galactose mutarotase-like enzyme